MADDIVIRTKVGVPVEQDFQNIVTRDGGFTRIYIVIDTTTGRPYTRLADGTIQPVSLGAGTSSGTNTGDVTLAGTPTYLTIAGQVITLDNVPTSAITGLSSYLLVADIDDTPVNGEVAAPISSNWAFDHVAAADPHPGYLTPTEGDAAYAPITKGVTNGDSHDHNGGDGAQVNHTTLSNIGTNTHAQIDTHIASTANPHSTTAAQVGAPSGSGTSSGANTGDVTLAGALTYLTIADQVITRGAITLTSDVTGTLPVGSGGTGITSFGTGVATFLGTPSSASLRAVLTDETGTGAAVFADSPALVTPTLGTPASGNLSNCSALPIGAVSGLGANVSTFLATPSSANLAAAVTGETGSGALVFATSPSLTTPTLGVASATSISFGDEALSVYDEGAWNPTPSPAGGAFTTITFVGTYTRIGRRVMCNGVFHITDKGTAAGTLLIALPFTPLASCMIIGWEDNVVAKLVSGTSTGANMELRMADGTTIYTNGANYVLSCSFDI